MARKHREEERLIQRMIKNRFVPGLVELLEEPEIRAASARTVVFGIMAIGNAEAWEAIGKIVGQHPDQNLVDAVILALGNSGAAGAMKALGEAVGNLNPLIRGAAVRALGEASGSARLAHLLRASRDPKASIARMAGRYLLRAVERDPQMLAEIRQNTAEGIIDLLDVRWTMEFLSDDYPDALREVAARRLGELGGEEATTVLVSVIEAVTGTVQEACWRGLESSGQVTDHMLLPLLASSDGAIRARALTVYGRFGDHHSEGLLSGFAGDPAPAARKAALTGLHRILGQDSVPLLVPALKDEDVEVRTHTTALLCKLEEVAPEMLEVVESERGEASRLALTYLANRGIVTPELAMAYMEFIFKGAGVTALGDRDYLDGITAAAKALAQEQVPEGLLALTGLARSIIRRLRRTAIECIMMYDPKERADALFSLVDSYDQDIMRNAAFGLHEAGDSRAMIPLIRTALEGKGRPVIKAKAILEEAEQSRDLDFLISCLSERYAAVRKFGADRLKLMKDPKAIPALLEASRDENVEVQLAVFEALGPFAATNEDVTKRMLEAVDYGDISVRQAACEGLGEARCVEAVPSLIKALHNFFLRPRATEALKRIGDRKGYLAMKRLERREKMFPKKPQEKVEMARRRGA